MQKFLRLFVTMAIFMVPWVTRAQNANVSEYDYAVTTAAYSSIAQTGTVWTAAEQAAGQVDVTMPFNMYLGTHQIASGTTMSVYDDGSVSFAALAGSRIAPLYYASGYTAGETAVYYRTTTTMVAIEWRKVVSGSNVYSFQLKLYNDNHVEFCYGPMTISSSLSVLVGLMSSADDIFRCGGTAWSEITRYTSGTTTRTLSTAYHPEYNTTTGQGLVYTFTQPACVKPSSLTASATAWNKVSLTWAGPASCDGFQVKYSTDSEFDPSTEGTAKNITGASTTTTEITGLMGSTDYYFYVRSVCGSTYSAWSPMASATTPNGCPQPTNLDVTSTGIVTWTGIANATTYDVKYGVTGFDPATEGTLINGIAATTTTVPTAGFPSQTTVDVYVRAYCSTVNSTYTDWVGPVSFVTPCAAITVNADNFYTESIGDLVMPQCWSEEVIAGTQNWDFSSGYAHFMYTPDASSRLMTPTFNLSPTASYQVEFYHAEADWSGICDSLWLYYRTSPTAAWVRLAAYGNHSSNLLKEIVLLPNPTATYQLAFVSYGMDGNSIYLAAVKVRTVPTCPAPTNIAATSDCVVTWTANTNNTSYDIVYGPAGFTSLQEGTVVENITGTTYTITGLTPGNYDVYVRAHCSATNEISEGWVGPASFTKAKCNNPCTYTLSMVDAYGDGWNGGQVNVYIDGALDNSYTIESGASEEAQIVVCPTEYLQFAYVAGSWADENSFTLTGYNGSTLYTCTDGSAETSGAVFHSEYACGQEPTCPTPHITSVTDAGVITWETSTNASSYEIKYGAAGFNVETEGTLVQNLTGTTYTITGLESMTSYDVYLRAVCSTTNETSNWTSASFTTACVPLGLPYTQDFESYTGGSGYASSGCDAAPDCWVVSPTDVSYGVHIGTQGAINGKGLVMTAGTSSCIPNNIAILPAFTRNLTQLIINFDYKMESASNNILTLGYVTNANDTSSFVPLTVCTAATTATHFEYAFAGNTIPDGARIAFNFYRSNSYYWVNIDNVEVTLAPSCLKPVGLNFVSATETTATIAWTEVNSATTWNVLYGPMGFDPTTEGTQVTVTSNPATISGLTGNTAYEYYVQSVCVPGEDISEWSNVSSFRTGCPATIALPYSEDFTNYSGFASTSYPYYGPSVLPGCWNYYSNGTNTAETSGSSSYYGGVGVATGTSYGSMQGYNNYLCIPIYVIGASANATYTGYKTSRGDTKYAVLPLLDQPLNNIMVSFDYKMSTAYSTTGAATVLEFGYITNNDIATFQPMQSVNATTTTQHIVEQSLATLAANAPAGARLAFKFSGHHNGTAATSGTIVYCGIDNIYIRQLPNCLAPSNVIAKDVTNSTAMIKWTENTLPPATNWTVKYGAAGFDPDNAGTAVAATADSIEITGLDSYSYFDVYVRAECSANETSEWSNVCSFRTACPEGGDVIFGNGGTTTVSGVPVNSSWGNTYCQQIFTAEELAAAGMNAGNIQGITFTWNGTGSYQKEFTIYMNTTNKAVFESTTDWITVTGAPAYGPALRPTTGTAGLQNYVFATPFYWDGSSNIVITTIMNQYGGSQSSSGFAAYGTTGSENRSLYNYRDSYAFSVNDNETEGTQHKYLSAGRANITFMAPCVDVTCFAPASVSVNLTPTNVATVNWTHRTDLRPIVDNYELKYGPAGFDPENAGTLVSNLNNVLTYTINEQLAYGADYDVYVRTVCGENDNSNWTKASFTTHPSCWVPDSVTVNVTAATQTSIALAWRENTPTPATSWEIAYGPEGFDPNNTAKANYVTTTNHNNYTLNGLHHSTVYDIYVRALCSTSNYSDWSAVVKATTSCGAWSMEDLPLVENFDGYTGNTSNYQSNHVMPLCWSYINAGTNTSYNGLPSIYNTTSYAHSTPNTLRFYAYGSTNYGEHQIAVLPEMGFALDTLDISFYGRFYNATSSIIVGVMTDPTNAETFEEIETINAPSSGYSTQTLHEVSLSEYNGNGRYIAFKLLKPTSSTGYNGFYMDDLTVKVREEVIPLTASQTVEACNAFVMLDTVNGTYANNINATYVVKPATAGKVAHLTGSYDMENGYDFINIYRGTATAANLIGTYTGAGSIDLKTSSYNWADSGFFTIVVTSDVDNALNNAGFKFLVSCECPEADTNVINDVVEANGTYTWTANNQTYNNHSTIAAAPDVTAAPDYTMTNVAGCDSVNAHLSLVLHPDYTINHGALSICQGETYEFYDTVLATTAIYTVTMTNSTGADSTGIINLTVNPLPAVTIKYNNEEVTAVNNFCDNFDMEIVASSTTAGATFLWDDSSTAATRVVNPHESNVYTVVATNPNTGCVSQPATLTVTTTPVPELTISGDSVICEGQSTTLTLSDANNIAATYRWTKDDVNIGTEASVTVNPTETATYILTATPTGATACAVSAEFTVAVNALPVVTLANSVNELCLGDSLTVSATEVEGYTYAWSTSAETAAMTTVPAAAGNYTATLTVTETATGCTNEFTSEAVAVHPSYELNDNQSACVGMLPITWGTMSLTEAGNYDQTFVIAHGCDSLVHLTFEIQDTAVTTTARELCLGTEFTFGTGIYEQTYTATETGVITYVDTTSDVCASRYNLNLTVNMPATTTDEATACDSYTWNGETYTTSGAYIDTLATNKGCDSVVTMNLTINYSNTGIDEQVACDSYEWIDGRTYTESTNTPTFTLTNAGNCDSVVTLNLTVNTKTYGTDEVIYCDGPSFTWINGNNYTTNTTGVQYTLATPNAAGCDSIVTLDLTMHYVGDEYALAWIDTVALDELAVDTVGCDFSEGTKYIHESGDYRMHVYDANGQERIAQWHVTINHSNYHTVFDTACAYYTWMIDLDDDGIAEYEYRTYEASGVYSYDKGNGNIEVLQLTINQPVYETTDTAVICQNGSWISANAEVFAGTDYVTGIYQWNTITSTDPTKCETRQMVDLTVNPVYNVDNEVVLLCPSAFTYVDSIAEYQYVYAVNDTTNDMIAVTNFDAVQDIDRSFAYAAVTGCDSIVNFHFTVSPIVETIQPAVACYNYTWELNGNEYTESGFDTVVVADENGCDSIVILDLTINNTVEGNIDTVVCLSFTWNDQTYTGNQSFLLEDGLTAQNGCDSITYLNFIVKTHQLNNQVVVANQPYTWVNGVTYTESVSNIFYDVTPDGECDSVLMLTLTMLDTTYTLCESELPYETDFGYTVAAGTTTGLDNAIDEQGSGFYIYNIINATGNTAYTEHGCDHFTWTVNGEEYTEAGDYTYAYAADANGCQRVDTLHLTISSYNEKVINDTACGSFTWAGYTGLTYTVSGTYYDTVVSAESCDTVVTLNLVIPAGQKYVVTECYEYTWERYDGTTQDFTASDSVGYSYVDTVSNCTVEDTLVLTINTYGIDSNTVIKNMASYTFNNVLYTAPLDTVIYDTVANATGCDSIHITRLIVSDGTVIDVDTLYCGNFQWLDGNVYGWISGQEALNNGTIFRYKNLTTNEYVYENPVYYVFDANGALDTTYVLWLTLAESSVDSIDYGTVLASQVDALNPVEIIDTNTNAVVASFDFAEEIADERDTTVVKEVRYGSAYYCDSIEYYTFHLVYNYTEYDTVIVCGAETEYTWREQTWPLLGAGYTTTLTDIANPGTADEWVYSINVTQHPAVVVTDTTATACDSFTWNDTATYTTTGDYQQTYVDANGCDSVVTLHLTVNYNSSAAYTATECYEYTWNRYDGTDSTYVEAGVHTYAYNDANNCPSVDTLTLTLTGFSVKDVATACDSYDWYINDVLIGTYTVSDTIEITNFGGCAVHDSLILTINYSNTGVDDSTVYGSYVRIADVMYEGPFNGDITYTETNAAGCDSVVTMHLVITPYRDTVINEVACGTYTWTVTGEAWTGNDHTYQWIPAEEREANNGALYRDLTTNEYVYTYPSDTVDVVIYRLNLALNEAMIIDTVVDFPLSQQMMTFGTETYNFAAENAAVTADNNTVAPGAYYGNPVHKTISMGSSSHYCDSIYMLTINLVNNYYTADTALCYTTDFEWNGKHHTVSTGLNTVSDTFDVNTPDERVVAMNVDVAGYLSGDTNAAACYSFTWHDSTYTASTDTAKYTYTASTGCDSIITLHLTINANNGEWNGATGDVVRCDSYKFHGNTLTESGDYVITWADDNGCEATDTFALTIVSATPSVIDTVVCDNFHWVVNNSDDTPAFDDNFTASATFGTKHYEDTLGQRCYATDSLFLTVRHSSSYDSVLYISDGSYRYGDTMLMATTVFDTFELYTNAEQCDSILNLTFHIGTAYFLTENVVSCDTFVWAGRTGDTYAWISEEERANGALYLNRTTGQYVTHNPIYVKENANDYDSIISLRLTLTQIYNGVDDTTFDISNGILAYGDSIFDFSAEAALAENFHDTTIMREVHFGSGYYCDSVINLYINLHNNFDEAEVADICATATEYTWRGQTISTANTDYDTPHTYHIYDTLPGGTIEYLTINQHQIAYITERRTACDSYTWEETGEVFTESTTITLGGGTDDYGCPAIVNLILTVNHSSSKVTDTVVCESFTWKANNIAQTLLGTFTNDTTLTYSYTSDEGCPSTDELNLVVNHNTDSVYRNVVVCDSYEWVDGNVYTVSGKYERLYNTAEGCPSTDSLYLTVKYSVDTAIYDTVCQSIVWNNTEYISSGHYTQNLIGPNGCDSTVTLYLKVGQPSTTVIDSTVCDSLVWNTVAYAVSGSYTDTLVAFGGCDSIVTINLTVNYADNRSMEAVACHTYHWDIDGNDYTVSGVYVAPGTNEFGCQSNDTLHLTIGNNRTYSYEEVVNCGPYTWIVDGETIGTYEESIETSATVVNPANGCDSIIFLTLTVKEAPVIDSAYTVCESAMPFVWRDTTLTEAGTVSVSFPLASGCDSTINMTLTVTPTINTVLNENVCLGLGYNDNNFTIAATELPTAGTYTFVDSLISTVTGCDSIVTLNITVGDLLTTVTEMAACVSYDWTAGNNTVYNYTVSGTYYTEPYINAQGCTSVDTLVLTINQPVATTDAATACDSYNWNGTEYTVSGEYVDTLATANGCDSVVTMTLTINNSVTTTDNATACSSYTWNNNEYTASGDYTDTLAAANGCDSIVTMTLVINMPVANAISETACGVYVWNDTAYDQSGTYTWTGTAANGCDSVVTLTLTVNSASTSEETLTVCDSYTWNGSTYTESGIYTYTTNNASGCDSVATLNLTVNVSTNSVDTVNACSFYEWNGTAYTTSGTYTFSATNAAGCDSTATLVLTVNQPVATAISETACESYTWNGATYSTTGDYMQTFTAANGCDSVVTLSLTINNAVNASETATACNSYTWNGTEYTTSGNYTYTTTAANGCDSIVTLTLTINEPATETVNATACSSYTWNGQTYTASGIYTYNTTAANGCDSIVTLALTVNQPVNTTINQTACDSYTWTEGTGTTYTTSGSYTYTTTAANNCDSVVTLVLTINNAVTAAETAEACDSYTWNGQTYTTSGTYTWNGTASNGCDSTVTLTLTVNAAATATETAEACDSYTWNGIVYAASGTYTYTTTAANGCDSVVTLNLTVNQSVAVTVTETAETNLVWNGVTYYESGIYTWTGTAANGCDSTVTLVLTINNSIYDTNYYTVSVEILNPGMGEVTGAGVYADGSVVTLVATPNDGFAFVAWMVGNDTVTTTMQHTFTVVSDTNFKAVFVALPVYYTVSGVANDATMGYVIQEPTSYAAGATAHLTAQAYNGYHFVRWSNGEATPDIYFTVTCDITLTAYFEADEPVTGVDETDMNDVTIYSSDTRIFVRGAEGYDVYVYDVNGRVMNSQLNAGEMVEFRMPATGVYLVKVGNAPAKRVLVVR